jgi:photosystem II stability/assembly factor-like uncharacterized protein
MSRQIFSSLLRHTRFGLLILPITFGISLLLGMQTGALADDTIAREPTPKSWQADAELTDVQFVDSNLGWAVGESGTLLRTRDGGLTWTDKKADGQRFRKDTMRLEQKVENLENGRLTNSTGIAGRQVDASRFTCRYDSVNFVDANRGWAVGGVKMPYIDRTQAVVMQTIDGGLSWRPIESLGLPRLRKIQFSNPRQGIAIGDSGNVFTGGIFQTNNGGKSWSGKLFQFDQNWIDVEPAGQGFVTINSTGQLGNIKNNHYEHSVLIGLPARMNACFRDIVMLDQKQGIALANNGLVFKTTNAGLSWNRLAIEKQHPQLQGIDWRTAAIAGNQIKLAGSPGAFVATLDLTTGRVQLNKTPIRSKLNQLFFLDENQGWAVGDFGVILSTDDGGKVWRQQRGSTRGLAMMVVSPTANQVPVELFGRYTLEDNLACGLVVLNDSFRNFESVRQASSRLGCSICELVSRWKANSADAMTVEQRLAKLVRSIRVNRPAVVVSQARKSFNPTPDDAFQLIARAVALAADPNAYPEQIDMGLRIHRVSRLAVRDPIGSISIDGGRMLVQSGAQLQDKVALSRALLGKPVINPKPDHYRIVNLQSNLRSTANGGLFRGLQKRELTQRLGKSNHQGNLMAIKFANESARQLETFIEFRAEQAKDVAVWKLQLRRFLSSMEVDVHAGGTWTMRLIEEYLARGNTNLAVESAEMSVSRFPNSPYAIAVATWLARYYSSHEFGKVAFEQQINRGILEKDGSQTQASRIANQYTLAPETKTSDGVTTLTWKPVQAPALQNKKDPSTDDIALTNLELESSGHELPETTPEFFAKRLRRSAQLLSLVGQKDPDFAAGPYCRWLEVQLAKRLSEVGAIPIDSLQSRYEKLTQNETAVGKASNQKSIIQSIAAKAREELFLLAGDELEKSELTKPTKLKTGKCLLIDTRPNLDGHLKEDAWASAQRILIAQGTSTDSMGKSFIRCCRDQEYFYLAIECQKLAGLNYRSAANVARVRDSDLSRVDQLAVEFDLDNDSATSFRFAVDHRGLAQESCQWIKDWNPDWYVANQETENQWIVEAAIPLAALAAAKIRPDDTWTICASRMTIAETPNAVSESAVVGKKNEALGNTVDGSTGNQSIFDHKPLRESGFRLSF